MAENGISPLEYELSGCKAKHLFHSVIFALLVFYVD